MAIDSSDLHNSNRKAEEIGYLIALGLKWLAALGNSNVVSRDDEDRWKLHFGLAARVEGLEIQADELQWIWDAITTHPAITQSLVDIPMMPTERVQDPPRTRSSQDTWGSTLHWNSTETVPVT